MGGNALFEPMSQRFQYSLKCDGCSAVIEGEICKSTNVLGSSITKTRNKAAQEAQWLFKNEGSKGVRHYCPSCKVSIPAVSEWLMQRKLTGKKV